MQQQHRRRAPNTLSPQPPWWQMSWSYYVPSQKHRDCHRYQAPQPLWAKQGGSHRSELGCEVTEHVYEHPFEAHVPSSWILMTATNCSKRSAASSKPQKDQQSTTDSGTKGAGSTNFTSSHFLWAGQYLNVCITQAFAHWN